MTAIVGIILHVAFLAVFGILVSVLRTGKAKYDSLPRSQYLHSKRTCCKFARSVRITSRRNVSTGGSARDNGPQGNHGVELFDSQGNSDVGLFDSHRHGRLQAPRAQAPSAGVTPTQHVHVPTRRILSGAAVCGTCPSDWEYVLRLARNGRGGPGADATVFPQLGLHPWYITSMEGWDCVTWVGQLERLLVENPHAGVGECGLDRAWRDRVPAEVQENVVRTHIRLAREYHRPLTIHAVGWWGRLLALLQATGSEGVVRGPGLPPAVVLHSCNSLPLSMLPDFLAIPEVYFSFSTRTLDDGAMLLAEKVPSHRLLVETDCDGRYDSLDWPWDDQDTLDTLNNVVDAIAARVGLTASQLRTITNSNSFKVFRSSTAPATSPGPSAPDARSMQTSPLQAGGSDDTATSPSPNSAPEVTLPHEPKRKSQPGPGAEAGSTNLGASTVQTGKLVVPSASAAASSGSAGGLLLRFDGCAKPNPGRGGSGFTLCTPDGRVLHRGRVVIQSPFPVSNNQAEYVGLIQGLRSAKIHGAESVGVQGDSMLIINQVTGQWKVKDLKMRALHREVLKAQADLNEVRYTHVRREHNTDADKLANEAVDSPHAHEHVLYALPDH